MSKNLVLEILDGWLNKGKIMLEQTITAKIGMWLYALLPAGAGSALSIFIKGGIPKGTKQWSVLLGTWIGGTLIAYAAAVLLAWVYSVPNPSPQMVAIIFFSGVFGMNLVTHLTKKISEFEFSDLLGLFKK